MQTPKIRGKHKNQLYYLHILNLKVGSRSSLSGAELKSYFIRFATSIKYIIPQLARKDGKQSEMAYLTLSNAEDKEKLLEGTYYLRGHKIRFKEFKRNKITLYKNTEQPTPKQGHHALVVTGLNPCTSYEDLLAYFSSAGTVQDLFTRFDTTYTKNTGHACVLYKDAKLIDTQILGSTLHGHTLSFLHTESDTNQLLSRRVTMKEDLAKRDQRTQRLSRSSSNSSLHPTLSKPAMAAKLRCLKGRTIRPFVHQKKPVFNFNFEMPRTRDLFFKNKD